MCVFGLWWWWLTSQRGTVSYSCFLLWQSMHFSNGGACLIKFDLTASKVIVTGEVKEGVSLAREVQEARNERPRREQLTPAYLEGYDRSHAEWRNT